MSRYTYAYDALGRLIAVTDHNATTNGTAVYSYDAVGNLAGITRQSATQLALFEFAPHQGAVGSTVTLSGTGFSTTGSNTVQFGSGASVQVTTTSPTQLQVTVPVGASTGAITVTITGVGSVASSQFFTVGAIAPTISSFTPTTGTPATYSSGTWTAGTTVSITGTNFDTTSTSAGSQTLYPNNTVVFTNGNLHGVVTAATSTQLQVEVPAGVTTSHISVTNPGGTVTTSSPTPTNPFFYVTPAATPYTVQARDWMSIGQSGAAGRSATFTLGTAQNASTLFAFDGTAGQQVTIHPTAITYSNLNQCGTMTFDVYSPDGTATRGPSGQAVHGDGCGGALVQTFTIPATGTFTMGLNVITNAGAGAATFAIDGTGSAQTLTVGGPSLTASFTTGVQVPPAQFFGVAGERLHLILSNYGWVNPGSPDLCGSHRARILTRTNQTVTDEQACGDPTTIPIAPLPAAGVYQIQVTGGGTLQSVTMRLVTAGTPTPTQSPTTGPSATPTITPTPNGSPTRVPTATPLTGPALVVRPNSIAMGRTVSADWALLPSPTTTDWIGLFPAGTPNDLNPFAQVNTTGQAGGQVSLPIPTTGVTAGNSYELHLISGVTRLVSNSFTITSATPSPTGVAGASLSVRPNRIAAGAYVSAAWAGIPTPTAADWIGLYVPNTTDSANLITPVNTTGQASGQVSVPVPSSLSPGDYELRLFNNSGTGSRLARSNLFTVTLPGTGLVPPAPEGATGDLALTTPADRPGLAPAASSDGLLTATDPAGEPLSLLGPPPLRLLAAEPRADTPAPGDAAETASAVDEDPDWTPPPSPIPNLLALGRDPSPWTDLPPLAAAPGTTALAGQVLLVDGAPLANVTLRLGDQTTRTDPSGRFLLADLPDGRHELVIDGRSASTPERAYGVFVVGADLVAGETSGLGYTVWLPRLDTANYLTIPSPATEDVVLTTPRIPGLEVHLPAGSVIRDVDGNPVTELGITAVPQDRPPFPLPVDKRVPVYFTIQPGGGTITPHGARLVYPNLLGMAPGARIDFGHYDPAGDGWYVYGRGTVTADGERVLPDPSTALFRLTGTSQKLDCHAEPTDCPPPPDPPTCSADTGCEEIGDPVDITTGLQILKGTDLVIPDLIPIRLSRSGRPSDSGARPFGIGTSHPYQLFLYVHPTAQAPCDAVCLILPDGGRVAYTRLNPGSPIAQAQFQHTATPSRWYMSTITWNSTENRWHLRLRDGTIYVFGSSTPLQAIRDRNGNQLTIYRDGTESQLGGRNGKIARIVSPSGRWLAFQYVTGSTRISSVRDNLGRTVSYAYYTTGACAGYLQTVTDPDSLTRGYTQESNPSGGCRLKSLTDAKGHTVLTNTFDATTGKVTGQAMAISGVNQSFDYSAAPTITVTQPGGSQRRMTTNSAGFLTQQTFGYGSTEPQPQTYDYTRDASNRITSTLDAAFKDGTSQRRQTDYAYDNLGNVITITRYTGTTTSPSTGTLVSSYVYEPVFSQLLSTTDPRGHTTRFVYDPSGNVTSVINPLGQETRLTYDEAGLPVSVSDAQGNTWHMTYAYGNLASVTDPQGRITRRVVDGAGRLVSVTDPRGFATRRAYDVLSRMTRVTDALNQLTQFGYDANGNVTSVTDALNHATIYGHDDLNRVTSRTDPLTRAATYEYDAASNLTKMTDRRGKVTLYGYDTLNRRKCAAFGVTAGTDPCAPTTYESKLAYTWDKGNRMTQVSDSLVGTPITRGYDDLDRLASDASAQGAVSYTYHSNGGPRSTMSVPNQSQVSYSYDGGERLSQITQGTATVGFGYDSVNRRSSLTFPNGVSLGYGYDTAGQLTGLTYTLSSSTIGQLSYGYDTAGLRSSHSGSYARTGLPAATTSTPTYNAANQLTSWNGTTHSYDLNGNLTNDGTNSYQWDARSQLSGINSGTTATFAYDALGRRSGKTLSSLTTSFLYDGLNPVQEQVSGSASANLLTGLGIDEYFTRTEPSTSTTRTLLGDALGSTIALLDNSGTVQTSYSYEAFGKATTSGSANSNPYKYTGREDDTTGLDYYRGRYYSPLLQRFISEDPIGFAGGSVNLYSYVHNSPINLRDPLGQFGDCPTCPREIPRAISSDTT